MKIIIPVSLCTLLSTVALAADESAPVIIDASPCLALTRPIERLTCFEDQAEAAKQNPGASVPQQNLPVVSIPRNTAARPAQPQPAPEAPQMAESADVTSEDSFEAGFGLPEQQDDRKGRGREMVARVAGIRELNPNRKVITLVNGQVWEQKETKPFMLEAGDEIRIYPTRWGSSFRLASQSHSGFITVQRLQ